VVRAKFTESESVFKINVFLDFEWIGRVAKGLWSLGEFAFRELLIFFEKIDTRSLKDSTSFINNINVRSHPDFSWEFFLINLNFTDLRNLSSRKTGHIFLRVSV
jgi:hypothetical protein